MKNPRKGAAALIYIEDSAIKIGGKLLPGVFKSMEIDGDAKVEEQEVKGSTSKPKQAIGYEDAKITIEIQLDDDYEEKQKRKTTLKKLAVIQNLFKKADQDKPVVYPIINEHTAARGIKQVIFKKLTTNAVNFLFLLCTRLYLVFLAFKLYYIYKCLVYVTAEC